MKRKREQSGQVFQQHGSWYVRFYESRVIDGEVKRVRVCKQIAEVTTRGKIPPAAVTEKARDILAAVNRHACAPEKVVQLQHFVDKIYFPRIEQHKRPSTLKAYMDIWTINLKPRCAPVWLKDVKTYHVQQWLDEIAFSGTLGRRNLQHIKSSLSAIFKLAKQQGFYVGGKSCPRYSGRARGKRAAANTCVQLERNPVNPCSPSRTGCDDIRGCVVNGIEAR